MAADERKSDVPRYFIANEKVLLDVTGIEPVTPACKAERVKH
jgi:hypothetical protein